MPNRVLRAMAGHCRSPIAQEVLVRQPAYRLDLASNQHLSPMTWSSMWGSKPSHQVASKLAERDLNPEQVTRVVTKERRCTVIRTMLRLNTLDDEQASLLLSRGLVDETTARQWWDTGRVPQAHRVRVARMAGPNAVVELAATTAGMGLEMVYEVASRASHGMLVELVDSKPELLDEILHGGRLNYALLGAACASRHLFDQDAMAGALGRAQRDSSVYLASWLVAQGITGNPNAGPPILEQATAERKPGRVLATQDWRGAGLRYCVTRPWEEETSPEGLHLLVKSAHTLPGRARFVGALPQLCEQQRKALAFYLVSARPPGKAQEPVDRPLPWDVLQQVRFDHIGLPTCPRPDGDSSGVVLVDFIRGLEAVLDQDGEHAWAAAIALLEDGWQSTIGELVSTARSL